MDLVQYEVVVKHLKREHVHKQVKLELLRCSRLL